MTIDFLSKASFPDVTKAFNEGFSDYALPVNATESYLRNRWEGARVDFEFSAGGWYKGELKGILVHGIDQINSRKVAFDAATCVAPEARGNEFTQRAYDFLLPTFKANGIQEVRLEVIQNNERAIRVYEKIGFRISRHLRCFTGTPQLKLNAPENSIQFLKKEKFDLDKHLFFQNYLPSWEHLNTALLKKWEAHECYVLEEKGAILAYLILAIADARIKQFYVHPERKAQGLAEMMFGHISQLYPALKIINIDAEDKEMCQFFLKIGLDGSFNQYEMVWDI